jgi:aspartyl-tRNA synthetase
MARLFKEIIGLEVPTPIQRMTWQEAMDRYGSDKPDTRFGMELINVSEVVKDCEFVVFKGALEGRATQITEEMKLAAALAIAGLVSDEELNEDNIMPQPFDPRVADVVANAVKSHIK